MTLTMPTHPAMHVCVCVYLTDLNDRVDMDEVQTLDLVRLQSMWTLHAREHTHNLLC